MDEKAKQFYAKVEKYGGWQEVPAERIHAIFVEIVQPNEIGFALAKKGFWVRRIDEDITDVLKLEKLKGGAYGMAYGVSLDLSERPQVQLYKEDSAADDPGHYIGSGMLGERCFREEMARAWELSSTHIRAWFEETRTLEGILRKCAEHLDRERPGIIRYVHGARLVRAFTLARTGQKDEAKAGLEIFLKEYQESDLARSNLTAALQQIQARSS